MKIPYQPVFWGDHYAETRGMTFMQSAIYLHLQGAYWSNGGPLANEPESLARAVGCSLEEWHAHSSAVLKLFATRGCKIVHARLDAQIASANRFREGQKERGSKGGKASVISRLSSVGQAETANLRSSIPSQAKPCQEEKKEKTLPPAALALDGFEDFWAVYSRRDARKSAEKAWPAALKAVGGDPSILVQAAKAYSRQFVLRQKDKKWQALPASWLNGERWNDSAAKVEINTPAPVEPMQETLRRLGAEIAANPPQMIIPTWFKGD